MTTLTTTLSSATTVISGLALLAAGTSTSAADGPQEADAERTMAIELKNTVTLEARMGGCEANLALEYLQKGNQAEVEIVVNNDECAASSGDFTILVRYRHDNGEVFNDEFPETWSRDDDQPVLISRLYPIGDEVDLIRVRSRGLNCTCTDEAAEKEEP